MARTKLFINGTDSIFLSSEIKLQGDRGIDQASFKLPPNVNSNSNDNIEYLQDIVCLVDLKAYLAFDDSLGDESGFSHDGLGFNNIPTFKSKWKFECNLADDGECNNTLTVTCGCATFTCGKVGCGKAFLFNGTRYLTAPNECNYDFQHFNKFSLAGWIFITDLTVNQGIITKSNDLTTGVGFKIFFCQSSNRINFTIADGTTAFTINSTACSISTCEWVHFAATYTGNSNESGMSIFINGECDTQCRVSSAISTTILNNLALTIGAESDGGSKIQNLGRVDDSYVFSTDLSASEAMRLFHDGSLSYQKCGQWGKSVKFDGCKGFIQVSDSIDFDLCGKFEMIWWMKAVTSCCERTVYHKTTNGIDGIDFTVSATTGLGNFRFGCTTISTTTDVANNTFRQIRVNRDACNLISIYVCNVKEMCATDATNKSTCVALEFGRNQSCAEYFNGELDSFRWYKGNLGTVDTCNLFTKKNPISIMKFGGKTTKIEKSISEKSVLAQSFGKSLAETEVRPKSFTNKSPEFIINDLVINNTCHIVVPYPVCSGLLITNYLADGKLFDLVDDLISLMGATFYTSGLNVFHFQPKEFTLKTNQFTHGCNTRVWETKFDDTELVNCITVLGENKRYSSVELFSGDGTTTVFTVSNPPIATRVQHPVGTEKTPEICFNVDTLARTITFCTAPVCGACNIQIDYDYEFPLFLRGKNQASIDLNGIHAKRLVLPWLKDRSDGTRFINSYLNRYSSVRQNLRIEHPSLLTSLRENDVIHVKNSIKGIDTTFVIKSLTYRWPKFETILDVGEYTFDDFEYDKQIAQKIHDLEGAITTIRDLRDFENPSECLDIIDVVNVNVNITPTECLAITDADSVTEIFDATYDCASTTYDDERAYV